MTAGPHALVVEDDPALRGVLDRGLQQEGFLVSLAVTGTEALAFVDNRLPDVVVIDIGLPDTDGRDLCQALRARGIQTPILFLTARDALVDRVAGFDAGGDDYLVKPFALVELVRRLEALVRRAGADLALRIGGLRLDPATHSVDDGSSQTPLTPTEFRLLGALLSRPGEAVRRRELIRAAWPHGAFVRDNTLDAYVARVRRKLKGLNDAPEITTVHGVGYRIG